MSLGGGGNNKSQTTTVQELSREQRQILKPIIPIAQEFATNPPQDYAGPRIAEFTPQERQAQALLGALYPTLTNQAGTASQGFGFLASGAALDPRTNPGLQGAIDAAIRPITQNYERVVMPSIGRNAVAAGQYGGTAQGKLQQQAAGEYGQAISDTASKLAFSGYQSGLEAMGRGLYALPTVQQGALFGPQLLATLGEQQRAMEQAKIDEAIRAHTVQQLLPWLAAKEAAGLAFGIPGGTSTTEAIGGVPRANPFASTLGGAMSGAAIGTAFGPGPGTGIGAGVGGLLGLLSALS